GPDAERDREDADEDRPDDRARLDRRDREEDREDCQQQADDPERARVAEALPEPAVDPAVRDHAGTASCGRRFSRRREFQTARMSTSAPTKRTTSPWMM